MSGNNTYKRLNDHEIEINGVIYTDGGATPTGGTEPLYPTGGSTPSVGSGSVGSGSVGSPGSSYVYVPGSAAPTTGNVMDYATWLQGNTKHQAEQDRKKAEEQAETDRQRSVVDANSAYQKGLATYGANAENLASMGLSGSGYGEYLTGKAYATRNAGIKAADALYAQRKDQALYTEGQIKQQADQQYAMDLLGFTEQTNASFQSDYNSALGGAAIETIQQNGNWAYYTPEQQNQILGATYVNTFKLKIDGGKTLDEIKSSAEWNKLNSDQQQMLTNYYTGKAVDSLKTMIDGGTAMAEIEENHLWKHLTVDQQNEVKAYNKAKTDAVTSEIEKNFSIFSDAIMNGDYKLDDILDLSAWKAMKDTPLGKKLIEMDFVKKAESGMSIEDMKNTEFWYMLGEEQQEAVQKAADEYDSYYRSEIRSVVANAYVTNEETGKKESKYKTKSEFEEALFRSGYTENEVNDIIAAWQEQNFQDVKKELGDRKDPASQLKLFVEDGVITQAQADALVNGTEPENGVTGGDTEQPDQEGELRNPVFSEPTVAEGFKASGGEKGVNDKVYKLNISGSYYECSEASSDVHGTHMKELPTDAADGTVFVNEPYVFAKYEGTWYALKTDNDERLIKVKLLKEAIQKSMTETKPETPEANPETPEANPEGGTTETPEAKPEGETEMPQIVTGVGTARGEKNADNPFNIQVVDGKFISLSYNGQRLNGSAITGKDIPTELPTTPIADTFYLANDGRVYIYANGGWFKMQKDTKITQNYYPQIKDSLLSQAQSQNSFEDIENMLTSNAFSYLSEDDRSDVLYKSTHTYFENASDENFENMKNSDVYKNLTDADWQKITNVRTHKKTVAAYESISTNDNYSKYGKVKINNGETKIKVIIDPKGLFNKETYTGSIKKVSDEKFYSYLQEANPPYGGYSELRGDYWVKVSGNLYYVDSDGWAYQVSGIPEDIIKSS